MLYFDRPVEEQRGDQQIGLKCVRVQMDMLGSSVNLVHRGFVTNQQTEVRSLLAYLATVMDTQISVTLRPVSVISHVHVETAVASAVKMETVCSFQSLVQNHRIT
jgi:hypothetical protein